MIWHGGTAPERVAKLFVRSSLPDFAEATLLEQGNDLVRLKRGYAAHGLCNSDSLNSNEFALKRRLAVLKEHCDDFLQVTLQLIE
jgi:hypothetical protein